MSFLVCRIGHFPAGIRQGFELFSFTFLTDFLLHPVRNKAPTEQQLTPSIRSKTLSKRSLTHPLRTSSRPRTLHVTKHGSQHVRLVLAGRSFGEASIQGGFKLVVRDAAEAKGAQSFQQR